MALSLGLMVVILFSQGQPGVSLDLGVVIDSFFPGDQVELPITLVSRNEAQVGHITMEVAFPSKVISLVGVKLGNGPTAAEAEVTTELVDAPEEAGAEAETELVDAPEEAAAETETELVDAPEEAAADLAMELEEPVDLERKILILDISASSALPNGLLATLTFEVNDEIAINHEIHMENVSQTAVSLDGQEVRARGIDGTITSIEFIPACLFYMH